jgi:hypothetical protein
MQATAVPEVDAQRDEVDRLRRESDIDTVCEMFADAFVPVARTERVGRTT